MIGPDIRIISGGVEAKGSFPAGRLLEIGSLSPAVELAFAGLAFSSLVRWLLQDMSSWKQAISLTLALLSSTSSSS